MRTRLIILLILLPAIPLVGLGWLGISTYKNEKALSIHREETRYLEQLQVVDRAVSERIRTYERHLASVIRKTPHDPTKIRALTHGERLVRNLFRLDEKGRLLFPAGDALTEDERTFLRRTDRIWSAKNMFLKPAELASVAHNRCDWFTWHVNDGLRLIYRCADQDGGITGAELDPIAVTSDLIATLPETAAGDDATADRFRIRLVDVDGAVLYQWGVYDPPAEAGASVSLDLHPPLTSFRLDYFPEPRDKESPFAESAALGLALGFLALLLVVVGLGVYFIRESSRDARVARERMTFVNQVSHELKTPLTNLRMYAELLAEYLEEEDAQGQRYVKVIVEESERLSRLIANVLSFARSARGKLTIRRSVISPDQIIRETAERFGPVFAQAGIEMVLALDAEKPRLIDGDALAQILGNLLGNVEKYAATGKWVKIESTLDEETLTITVRDAGDGIPPESRQKIFDPFYRISNKLTDGVAGTGIGLAICRELAIRHGGDVVLSNAEQGAAFAVTLNAPKPKEKR